MTHPGRENVGSSVEEAAVEAVIGPPPPGSVLVPPAPRVPLIISGFKDFFHLSSGPNELIEVGNLALPAGLYSIWAKLYLGVGRAEGETIRCRLQAENDFDVSSASHDGNIAFVPIALNVVHAFNAPGSVTLTCEHEGIASETDLHFIKITAISGMALSNSPLP